MKKTRTAKIFGVFDNEDYINILHQILIDYEGTLEEVILTPCHIEFKTVEVK